MSGFIYDVIDNLKKRSVHLSSVTFILPSKRAGLFLRETVIQLSSETIFAPEILSIEEFVQQISGLEYVSNSELLFEFYKSYLTNTPKDQIEPFDQFSKWGQILIQDFNEIDRYLIDPNHVFEYLSAIKEIENQHWSLDESPTQYIKNYLLFWKRLGNYYHNLKDSLLNKQLGYQGMVYKDASKKISEFVSKSKEQTKKYVFLGFNALNAAEEKIIKTLLQNQLAEIYWDIDKSFLENKHHDAGLFIREHLKTWKHFEKNRFKWSKEFYSKPKHIEAIGTPKNIGQVKYVGELISKLASENTDLRKTAVVLGDESLLLPLLNSIPKEIDKVNITMGLPLHLTPMAALFENLFKIHQFPSAELYYKDVLNILNSHYIKTIIQDANGIQDKSLTGYITNNNLVYIKPEELENLTVSNKGIIKILFASWNDQASVSISNCKKLILILKESLESDKKNNKLSLEYLYKFDTIFNELQRLNHEFEYIDSIKTLNVLFRELLKNETLDFQGEPLEGLQIMGMLETRVLDFETVILTSVNEGILPAGKSDNSFIPFDVKIENELPTYKEKDAVYTYHFYRMLQRAKNIYIIYNTEPDVLKGGEKSRFITQLLVEKKHDIIQKIVSPKVPIHKTNLQQIKKTASLNKALNELAFKGFSPSSLTNYIRNPIDFYMEKILGIEELDDVEEHVAHNTLGTVVHNSLEDFYRPLEGKILTVEAIKQMKKDITKTVEKHFEIEFKSGNVTQGKNLIIFEIAKRYINNFLDTEISQINSGNSIRIIFIEAKNEVPVYIEDIDRTITLKGKVDRVDDFNGRLRIIDYKTGRVEQGKVEIVDWDDILTDYDKYSKSFQLLMYTYMMKLQNKISLPVEAGVYSFKNLNAGLLRFATKPSSGSRKKDHLISEETLEAFEIQLKSLISEIYNPEIPFIEKLIK